MSALSKRKHHSNCKLINYRGYIYGESRKLLDKFIPELDHIELMATAIK
jgi:hypothetical protein